MICIAVTQRVTQNERGERRDALDQRWSDFLFSCDILPLPLPNNASIALKIICKIPVQGILLTGGGDLLEYGGDTPERDETERNLIKYAREKKLPLLGVCRGMEAIQDFFGMKLKSIEGHVVSEHSAVFRGTPITVNSYHHFGTTHIDAPFEVLAVAHDGVIEAIRHKSEPILAMMWHPERMKPFASVDIEIFKAFFHQK